MNLDDSGISTKLIHAGEIEDQFGSATVPKYQTSTFRLKRAQRGTDCFSGESDGYVYARIANPTIRELEQYIAALENGFVGFATGSDRHYLRSGKVLVGIENSEDIIDDLRQALEKINN